MFRRAAQQLLLGLRSAESAAQQQVGRRKRSAVRLCVESVGEACRPVHRAFDRL